jgi:hypothetical protein
MAASTSTSKPKWTSDTVFFVGNGVMRVAPLTGGADSAEGVDLLPSWAEYMLSLWKSIEIPETSEDYVDFEEFSRLVGPRQAEWFDRLFKTNDRREARAFRMHLLGKTLHRDASVLSNPLLVELANAIVHSAAQRGPAGLTADVITTNVDCLLEQNIAAALDAWPSPFREAVIESVVDFRTSGLWRRVNLDGGSKLHVRIWKVHGCLRDLKLQLQREAPKLVAAVLKKDAALTKDAAKTFGGDVPTDRLADNLSSWEQTAPLGKPGRRLSGSFSQSEYFDNLDVLTRQTRGGVVVQHIRRVSGKWANNRVTEFSDLLKSRPLIFVGYSIPEVDVDIVYALHRFRQPDGIQRWQLLSESEWSVSSRERLRQLGIDASKFTVRAIGYAAVPGKLNAARRYEWRTIPDEHPKLSTGEDWRRAIQRVSSRAWLDAQLGKLRLLDPPGQHPAASPALDPGPRLVVAGLGSIWHGFALLHKSDFPGKRRASTRMISVDQQVPGGSGLVPIVIAAAMAGPPAVGRFAFCSNVPANWSGWAAIQDLCHSAGIETHPWDPSHAVEGSQAVGRTSHIIFFDPDEKDETSDRPRQRFIMDVQSLAGDKSAPRDGNWSALRVPAAQLPKDFQKGKQEDFLFTDKEADPQIIKDWTGPTVYETGTTGLELVTRLRDASAQPTIWTAGVGSFVRTMAALVDPAFIEGIPKQGYQSVLDQLRKHQELAYFYDRNDERHDRYLAKVIGGESFSYPDEEAYSTWLRDNWAALAPNIWDLLGADTDNPALKEPYMRIGRGLVTTIHEGGLMALWEHKGQPRQSIVVKIGTVAVDAAGSLKVTCALVQGAGRPPQEIVIDVNNDSVVLNVPGRDECRFGPTAPIRRNSLAAGDTVRGAMAYGLWAAAYGPNQSGAVDMPRILLASAALASLKCYAGSFVDFLKMVEKFRGTPAWNALWATTI